MTLVTPIPALDRTSATFQTDVDTYFGTRIPQLTSELNSLIGLITPLFTGSATSIPYNFDATNTVADPGVGNLRFSSSPVTTVGAIIVDPIGSDAKDYTNLLTVMGASGSSVRALVRVFSMIDPTKWAMFSVSAITNQTGYFTLATTYILASSTSGTLFSAGEPLGLAINRVGDIGPIGPAGSLTRRTTTVATTATLTPNMSSFDECAVTALASALMIAAPTGVDSNGTQLIIRIRDNGTARALSWATVYRASSDLLLPSSTVANKTLYVCFLCNKDEGKYDLVGVLNNFS